MIARQKGLGKVKKIRSSRQKSAIGITLTMVVRNPFQMGNRDSSGEVRKRMGSRDAMRGSALIQTPRAGSVVWLIHTDYHINLQGDCKNFLQLFFMNVCTPYLLRNSGGH
jgi:hypothetical protein